MEENVNKIIENGEEVMENIDLENAELNSSQRTFSPVVAVGIGISVGIMLHRYVIQPVFGKIKSKLEQRKAAKDDEPEPNSNKNDENESKN